MSKRNDKKKRPYVSKYRMLQYLSKFSNLDIYALDRLEKHPKALRATYWFTRATYEVLKAPVIKELNDRALYLTPEQHDGGIVVGSYKIGNLAIFTKGEVIARSPRGLLEILTQPMGEVVSIQGKVSGSDILNIALGKSSEHDEGSMQV